MYPDIPPWSPPLSFAIIVIRITRHSAVPGDVLDAPVDQRALETVHDGRQIGECTDRGSMSSPCSEPTSGLHLRSHRACGEVVLGERGWARLMNRPGIGSAPSDQYRLRIRGHDQKVGVELTGKKLRAQVLVDHGLDANQLAVRSRLIHGRNASTAGADHDRAVIEQPLDGPQLEDAARV